MSADHFVQPLDRRPDDCAAPAEAIQQDADAPGVGFIDWLGEHPWWRALVLGVLPFALGVAAGLAGSIAGVI
jgi:hypothetical protein